MSLHRAEATTTQKKYPRSTSPREHHLPSGTLCRLQNRIAQRNHRQRLKEIIQVATSDDGTGSQKEDDLAIETEQAPSERDQAPYPQPPDDDTGLDFAFIDPQLRSTSREGSSFSSTVTGGNFMGSTLPQKQHSPSWLGVDQMMMMNMPPVPDAIMSHQGAASYSSCDCNSVTGPCPGHLDKIRADIISSAASSSPLQHMQQMQQNHRRHPSMLGLEVAFPQAQPQRYPMSVHNSHISSPMRSAPSTTSSTSLLPGSRSPSVSGHWSLHEEVTSSTAPSSIAPQSASTSSSTGAARESSPANLGSKGTSGGATSRFKTILEASKAAGFSDFDKMVIAYYTSQFERSSIAAMAQKASRGRRLRSVVQELQAHSNKWSRWESRELQESFLEATKSLCIEEIEHLETELVLNPAQMEADEINTVFSCLFNHGDDGDEMQVDRPSETIGGLPRRYVSSLSERGEVAQDSVPHLWSLLTELAGPHSIYCDRIAQMILAILLDARRTQ
ncbi:hypothetical protein PG987_000135 [Apiospora arundinis]